MDYFLALSPSHLTSCDTISSNERDKNNRKKLIEIYDEKNGYILLKMFNEYRNNRHADTYMKSTINGKEYFSQEVRDFINSDEYLKYRAEDYNIPPLFQIVRYYTKNKEPIIIVNAEWGGNNMR